MEKEELLKEKKLIIEIVKRADDMQLLLFDRISLIMDLECVNEELFRSTFL